MVGLPDLDDLIGATDDRPVDTDGDRAMTRSFRLGAAVGLVAFLAVLTGLQPTLLQWSPAGGYYDAQAGALLDGRLDIDPALLDIEGFESGGRTYMYQPLFPALARVPVLAVTDSFTGRLGPLSMLVALLVAASATRRILGEARTSIRPGAPSTTVDRTLAFGFGVVLTGGSVPVFLASRGWVYHESAMWGMAWTLAAVAALLRHRRDPSWGQLALVALAATAAVGSRASVGAGAVAAVGLLAVVRLAERRGTLVRRRLAGPGGVVALVAAAAAPVAAYAGLNLAKFGTVASIPFANQAYSRLSPARQAMLEANDGTLFGLQFAPTTLWHYLRPTGIDVTATFPFVDFRPPGGPIIGDVVFDAVDRAGSVTTTLLVLLIPALLGLWVTARGHVGDRAGWAAVLTGSAVGSATIIPFGYVAHRYLADVMPLLVVAAALGVQWLVPRIEPVRWVRIAGVAMAMLLTAASVWVNAGLATVYQRQYAPNVAPDLVAGLVRARLAVGDPPRVVQGDSLPATAATGDLAVVGDCEALYLWFGPDFGFLRPDAWIPVERTPAAGHLRLVLDADDLEPGVRYPVVVAPRAGPVVVWLERDRDGDVTAGIDDDSGRSVGRPVPPAGRTTLDVVLDPHIGEAAVRLGDQVLVRTLLFPRGSDVGDLSVGSNAGVDGYASQSPVRVPTGRADTELCRAARG